MFKAATHLANSPKASKKKETINYQKWALDKIKEKYEKHRVSIDEVENKLAALQLS